MKSRLAAFVGIFCIALLVVSGAYAAKPVKTPKPEPPGRSKPECIVFTDNPADSNDPDHVWLVGGQDETGVGCCEPVVGCCPNAGPSPEYTMTLHNICYSLDVTGETCLPEDRLDGYLFINVLGTPGPNQRFMVKFWTWEYNAGDPGVDDYFFEIRGGVMEGGGKKKDAKPSTVTYTNETATLWVYYNLNPNCSFSDFHYSGCNPCIGVEPGCDPLSDDPYCYDPCNEEFLIENVSFVLTRTSDLNYCE